MAWLYMAICAFDFIIAPVLFILSQAGAPAPSQWIPLTLGAGGMVHLAFGGIVGVYVWSRGQEKLRYMQYFENVKEFSEGSTTEQTSTPVSAPSVEIPPVSAIKKEPLT